MMLFAFLRDFYLKFEAMNGRTKRRIWRIVKTLIITYFAGGIILYFIQDLLLFHPTPLANDHQFSFDQPFEEMNIAVEKNNLSIVKFKTDSIAKGVVLFYHGNMNNAEHYKKYPLLFTTIKAVSVAIYEPVIRAM